MKKSGCILYLKSLKERLSDFQTFIYSSSTPHHIAKKSDLWMASVPRIRGARQI